MAMMTENLVVGCQSNLKVSFESQVLEYMFTNVTF